MPVLPFKFIDVQKNPSTEILGMLSGNVIGTEGKSMLYQHTDVTSRINRIEFPYFVNLQRHGETIGTCCFCLRNISNGKGGSAAFYIRYFSFKTQFRRGPVARSSARKSRLRQEIMAVFQGIGFPELPQRKFLHYAYVDPRNWRSVRLCEEFGFQIVREYTTVLFSRINPRTKTQLHIEELAPQDYETVKELLKLFYREYAMFSLDNLRIKRYYVLRNKEGDIVAGMMANPTQWNIVSFPGIVGKLILNVFPHLPVLNRLLNKDFRFLAVESIYYAPGHAHDLEPLFESLLALFQLNTAIVMVDRQGPLHTTLKSLNLGILDKVMTEVKGHILCRFVNMDPQETTPFKVRPAYISAIDVT